MYLLRKTVFILLLPFSIVYGSILSIRNRLFDWKLIKSKTFETPVISVGNLNLGGIGKTPHIEYLIRLLQNDFNVATLSRGYKRTSKGFTLANNSSTVADIGDEPLQYFNKFQKIKVAVDEKRVNGINQLKNKFPNLNAILLDDAYQHRYVTPGINILATAYNNLYTNDYIVPAGRLREWKSGSKRADLIIVTKCPTLLSFEERNKIKNELKPKKHQPVFFSYLKYGPITPFTNICNQLNETIFKKYSVLLISAIANPKPLVTHIKSKFQEIEHIQYNDHHNFTEKDIEEIKSKFESLSDNNKLIITTEKDIMRLSLPPILKKIQNFPIYYIPIEICFHGNDKEEFNTHILNYVKSDQGNQILSTESD